MSGYAVAQLDEIDEISDGRCPWRPVRHHFGITSFGVNAWTGRDAGELEPAVPAHRRTLEPFRLLLGDQDAQVERVVEGERAEFPRGKLGHEQVACADRASGRADDRPREREAIRPRGRGRLSQRRRATASHVRGFRPRPRPRRPRRREPSSNTAARQGGAAVSLRRGCATRRRALPATCSSPNSIHSRSASRGRTRQCS